MNWNLLSREEKEKANREAFDRDQKYGKDFSGVKRFALYHRGSLVTFLTRIGEINDFPHLCGEDSLILDLDGTITREAEYIKTKYKS